MEFLAFWSSIRLKIIVGFLIGVLSIGLFSVYAQHRFGAAMEEINEQARILESAHAMASFTKDTFQILNTYLYVEDPATLEELRSDYAISSYNAHQELERLKNLSSNSELLERLESHSERSKSILQEMLLIHDAKLLEQNQQDNNSILALETREKELFSESQEVQELVQIIFETIVEDADSSFNNAIAEFEDARHDTNLLLYIIIIYSAGLAIVIANSLSKPITYLRDMAGQVGKGARNLKIEAKGNDEIAELAFEFNRMVDHLGRYERDILDKNKRLLVANEKLKELDKEKDEFIAIAAHELKNPIAAIKSFGELLVERRTINDKKKLRKFSKYINECTNDLYYLAVNLVDSARLSLGKFEYSASPVNVNKFFKENGPEITALVRAHGIKASFMASKSLPKVGTDPDRLMQVVRNLVLNAIHYTPKGGAIDVRAYKGGKGLIEFSVKDSGIGIPEDKQDKIFSRFYQAGNRQSNKAAGSGLGLSICKGIVEAMGGRIWFESVEGKGTTFFFSLPVTQKKPRKELGKDKEK
ncbi:HAMP domain-containing histidine kinase [Candidatus Woesearchaeota archaeon]|nr:HAMP domain-containing histidine kinase [Candidatus Woesearchaeota archaeon]